ncbi:MAG: type II secretion system minor pseudopilin GspK, partial [Casimicrobiaceae bacterium]
MLLTALGAAVAAQMLAPIAEWLGRERRAADLNAAYTLADAASAWALTVLAADRLRGDADHLGEPWATRLPATPIEGGVLEGYIVDLQAQFNLNSLVDRGVAVPAVVAAARRVFAARGLDPSLADRLADALDADDLTASGQSEQQRYGRRLPNQPLSDLADLERIPGFGEAAISALAGHVAVLPTPTRVNANTAEVALLAVLLPEVEPAALTRFIEERGARPLISAAELPARLRGTQPEGLLSAGSDYFGVEARIRYGSVDHRLQLRIHRPATARLS